MATWNRDDSDLTIATGIGSTTTKNDINMGKGAVKALIWVGSLLGIIFGLLNLESK